MTPLQVVFAGAAGFAAGAVNAVAGGGTLISFPILIALGLPSVSANVTNTVALSPGYLGGALAQRSALSGQSHRVRALALAAAGGGLIGSILLIFTSDDTFRVLIPVLLLVATGLLALQDRLRVALRIGQSASGADEATAAAGAPATPDPRWLVVPIVIVSVYGGYFGAGLGIMLLAVLGIVLHDRLDRLNALKQVLAFAINATAAVFFLFSGRVYWVVALVMAVTSLLGGSVGGRFAGSIKPARLRAVVVVIGLAVAVGYAAKTWL
jgi:uncharacterized membrane protein YfcA